MTLTPGRISDLIAELYIKANRELPAGVITALEAAARAETCRPAREAMRVMIENAELAAPGPLPICQDTGAAVVFCEWGGGVTLSSGTLQQAVDAGVARACREGFMRASMVSDPLRRENTGDNTPAVIHVTVSEGERAGFTVMPKGFGSENMTALRMFTPSDGADEIIEFITSAISAAGANPCPPVIVGVGLGGTAEQAVLLAKRALLRAPSERHEDAFYAGIERRALERVNALGIGAQGFGGAATALGVNILTAPTHIAGLPCAVAPGCWVTRHASGSITCP
ncbi:MAG: fumarate hydratase [Oscillospiraceae bacterium]|nr:fumarate hydratase [Oscillospiraceae bacterium]